MAFEPNSPFTALQEDSLDAVHLHGASISIGVQLVCFAEIRSCGFGSDRIVTTKRY